MCGLRQRVFMLCILAACCCRHPDRNRGNEAAAAERFKEVQEAFTVLSDPMARATYDKEVRKAPWTPHPDEPDLSADVRARANADSRTIPSLLISVEPQQQRAVSRATAP